MASGTTPLRKRPIPLETDVPHVVADMTSFGDSADNAPNVFQATSSTLPPGTTTGISYGDICQVTDTNQWMFWSGTAWVPMLVPGGWQPASLASGIAAGSGYETLQARQEGDLVRLKGSLGNSSSMAPGVTWATLPVGLRPAEEQWRFIQGHNSSGNLNYMFNISTAGQISSPEFTIAASTTQFFDDIVFTLN